MSRTTSLETAPAVTSPDGRALATPWPVTASDADLMHLADASSEHTMETLPALDEEISRIAADVQDVLAAVHRVRQLRGLRRAEEEGQGLEPHGSDSPQEVLQQAALLKELAAQLGAKRSDVDAAIADAEEDVHSAIQKNREAVDRLRYLQALRSAIAKIRDHDAVTVVA